MGTTRLLAHPWFALFVLLSWAIALGWLAQGISALRGMPTLPDLTAPVAENLPALPPAQGPHLTVIVPACNEEQNIQATLHSLLASTGLRLQILAVDDRSTDRTGARIAAVAAEAAANHGSHTLEHVTIAELPSGWLGKPHAMALAASRAAAPWILFTDADVLFEPHTLSLALRQALAAQADHLILIPTLILKTIPERAMLGAMQAFASWGMRLWKVADPRTRDFLGVGGFNLVRRSAYESIGGFEAFPLEALDDLRLGWALKRAGFLPYVALGPGLARIRWLHGALAIVPLVEKNGFAVSRFRVSLHLGMCVGLVALLLVPVAALFGGVATLPAALFASLGLWMLYRAQRRMTGVAPWYAIFFVPMSVVMLYAFVRSMVLAVGRGGIRWRGTFYPLAELRRSAGRGFWKRSA
ncbi:MAG TPA: glycosyltransferase family A protein [Terracidiphilus sp.]|nr:glycosyltransferase family A protein [Terracidiphilus sp.]